MPADHRLGRPGSDRGPLGAQLIYSDDHGDSWRLGAIDASYNDGVNANETTVVELNDGRLYVNTRDQKGNASGNRAAAYSSDGGLSFDSTAEPDSPFVPLDAPFDPPIVQCSLLRYYSELDGDDSNLILFCGPDESGPSGPGRSDLRIRYTTNETHSWQDGSLIHEGPAAYSDMVKLDGDDLGILFEAGSADQARYNRIDFIRLPIASALDSSASD